MKKEYIVSNLENQYNGISIELGQKEVRKDATGKKSIIQNINILYKGVPIINQDYDMKNMVVQIFPDINEAIVGNIFLPEEVRGKGLTKYIYQAVADKLDIPIVNSLSRRDRLGVYYNQSEAGSRIWKKRNSFIPKKNNENKNSLEGKVIPSIFIFLFTFSLLLLSPNLTGNIIGTSETGQKFIGIILFLLGISGFFIYKKLRS